MHEEPKVETPRDGSRMALILATVSLLVARPLVPGEDPSFLSTLTDPGSATLTMLWFLLAAAWVLQGVLTKKKVFSFGLVEVGLAGVALAYFVSGEFAPAVYPARLAAWEMLGMAACFISMRQATPTEQEQRPLWNALMATAFCVALQGVYQYGWEMPYLRGRYGNDLEKLKVDFAQQNTGGMELDEVFLSQLRDRVLQPHIYATYSHPNSLASFLVLLAPSIVLAGVAAFHHVKKRTAFAFALAIIAAYFLAIWFNFSRGGMGALLLIGFAYSTWLAWKKSIWRKWHLGLTMAGLGVALIAWQAGWLDSFGKKEGSGGFKARLEHWQGTWRLIQAKPVLGTGPGNFGNTYTSFMNPTTEEKIKDPHNFLLELWSNAGLAAPIIFLLVLARLFTSLVKFPKDESNQEIKQPIPPWVLYLGGMFGLLLGFVLRMEYRPPEDLVGECIAALIRTAGWFFAFGVLENLVIPPRARVVALALGLSAALINLSLSGSIVFSSVMIPFWAVAALAFNTNQSKLEPRGVRPVWAFPIAAGLAAFYAFGIFLPLATAFGLNYQANKEGHSQAMNMGQRTIRGLDRVNHLIQRVISPIHEAARQEPLNSRWPLGLSTWYPVVFAEATRKNDPVALSYGNAALRALEQAEKLDPLSAETALTRYHLRSFFAEKNKKEAAKQYQDAAEGLAKAILKDPYEARWYFLQADSLASALKADPKSKSKTSQQEKIQALAKNALALDSQFKSPARKLNKGQREKAVQWALGKGFDQ